MSPATDRVRPVPAGEDAFPAATKPLLIKRYASRRLYNTETSDYVTLDDIARVVQSGRDVSVIDLKTGDDVTRQYLLQIIAEHEAKGENVLPVAILTDLIRSYSGPSESVVAQFLSMSFEMLQGNRAQVMKNLTQRPAPDPTVVQPEVFVRAMLNGCKTGHPANELAEIRSQLADLQDRLSRL